MWTRLRDRNFVAADVSSPARTETLETYEAAIPTFEDERWTYIPMPDDGEYYDIAAGVRRELVDEQYVSPDRHLLEVMETLLDYPFLLVDADGKYEIIHLSDINKREVKDLIYPVLSELAHQLSKRIEAHYENSEDLFDWLSPTTIGLWIKAEREDVELHIAEHMALGDMRNVIRNNDALREDCGFSSKSRVDKLGGIENLRNRVMHGNRTLVTDRDMLEDHFERIDRAERIVTRLA